MPQIDFEFVEQYQQYFQQANIQNPLPIEDFLNPIDKKKPKLS